MSMMPIELNPAEDMKVQMNICELHHERFELYRKKLGMSLDKAVVHLIRLHRAGRNVAEEISFVINEDHGQYKARLRALGEADFNIR